MSFLSQKHLKQILILQYTSNYNVHYKISDESKTFSLQNSLPTMSPSYLFPISAFVFTSTFCSRLMTHERIIIELMWIRWSNNTLMQTNLILVKVGEYSSLSKWRPKDYEIAIYNNL